VDFTAGAVRVRNPASGSTLNVDVSALTTTGTERIRYEGTFDAFSTLVSLRDILRNENGTAHSISSERLTQTLADIDAAHETILSGLRDIGFRSNNLTLVRNRIEGLQINASEAMSLERDADIVSSIVEFNQRDTLYQASLRVSAQVVQVSLLNFLR
jgi:flagellar hook-associated protein 3 FlgL